MFSDLTGRAFDGKPILVIGGGPTASADLERLPRDYFGCVISANEHGFKQSKFEVDFIVNVDFTRGSGPEPMETYFEQFGVPVINKWSWADFRLPEWSFNGDSGFTAIAVACMLGGHPVVPVGIDRYVGERRYFWDTNVDLEWARRRTHFNVNGESNMRQALDFTRHSQIRVLGGAMREHWRPWSEREILPPWEVHPAPQVHLKGWPYSILTPIFLHPSDPVYAGPILLTENESKGFTHLKKITPWGVEGV